MTEVHNSFFGGKSSTMKIGQKIAVLRVPISLLQNVMYAAATWDFFRLHYDSVYAKKIGLHSPVCDGQMLGSLLVKMIVESLGKENFELKHLKLSYKKMTYVGDILRFEGNVKSIRIMSGSVQVVLDLSAFNQNKEQVISNAEAILVSKARLKKTP